MHTVYDRIVDQMIVMILNSSFHDIRLAEDFSQSCENIVSTAVLAECTAVAQESLAELERQREAEIELLFDKLVLGEIKEIVRLSHREAEMCKEERKQEVTGRLSEAVLERGVRQGVKEVVVLALREAVETEKRGFARELMEDVIGKTISEIVWACSMKQVSDDA